MASFELNLMQESEVAAVPVVVAEEAGDLFELIYHTWRVEEVEEMGDDLGEQQQNHLSLSHDTSQRHPRLVGYVFGLPLYN